VTVAFCKKYFSPSKNWVKVLHNKTVITPPRQRFYGAMKSIQSKMARAAIGWQVEDLAREVVASPDTIARFERGDELQPRTVQAIRKAFEAQGLRFIEEGGEIGVVIREGVHSATRSLPPPRA
jgi:DNA-binding XRE family transcriptional regulator